MSKLAHLKDLDRAELIESCRRYHWRAEEARKSVEPLLKELVELRYKLDQIRAVLSPQDGD